MIGKISYCMCSIRDSNKSCKDTPEVDFVESSRTTHKRKKQKEKETNCEISFNAGETVTLMITYEIYLNAWTIANHMVTYEVLFDTWTQLKTCFGINFEVVFSHYLIRNFNNYSLSCKMTILIIFYWWFCIFSYIYV